MTVSPGTTSSVAAWLSGAGRWPHRTVPRDRARRNITMFASLFCLLAAPLLVAADVLKVQLHPVPGFDPRGRQARVAELLGSEDDGDVPLKNFMDAQVRRPRPRWLR